MLVRNVVATYGAQGTITLLGFVTVPIHVHLLGTEAYGLVVLFAALQAWFQILDLGISPALANGLARSRAGALKRSAFTRFYRLSLVWFGFTSLLLMVVSVAATGPLVGAWIKPVAMPLTEVETALQLMLIAVAMRWLATPFRAIFVGNEKLARLAAINVVIAFLRFVGVLVPLVYVKASVYVFFAHQLLVSFVEVGLLSAGARRHSPATEEPEGREGFSGLVSFAVTASATSVLWSVAMQMDKVVGSVTLDLSAFAVLGIAAMGATIVTTVAAPLGLALLPRLTILKAQGDIGRFNETYLRATAGITMAVVPIAAVLSTFPVSVGYVWLGDVAMSKAAASVLAPYAMGNAVMALNSFGYYLQYASGSLRLHAYSTLMFAVAVGALATGLVTGHGATGLAWAWLIANLLHFVIWVPYVHLKLAPGLYGTWVSRKIGPGVAGSGFVVCSAWALDIIPSDGRLSAAVGLLGVYCLCLLVSAGLSSDARTFLSTTLVPALRARRRDAARTPGT